MKDDNILKIMLCFTIFVGGVLVGRISSDKDLISFCGQTKEVKLFSGYKLTCELQKTNFEEKNK